MNKLTSTITMAKRVGGLTIGFDLVKMGMQTGEVLLVLTAVDLSPKTKKEVEYLADQLEVPCCAVDLQLDEIWYLVGKRAGVIGVTHPAFAEKLKALLPHEQREDLT